MPLSQGDRDAITILNDAADRCIHGWGFGGYTYVYPRAMLARAIRYLAYPDRARYPKVRGSRKGHPVERQPAG